MLSLIKTEDDPLEEFECMKVIDEAFKAVADDAERSRIAGWVVAKYLKSSELVAVPSRVQQVDVAAKPTNDQIAGIAKLSQSGELQLTVRDFKAKSANDAAVRLIHVVVWASGKLIQERSVSSKNVIVPMLKKYRCYDGNTRSAIAKDKGLLRDGDTISLDFHAEQFAEKVVMEILDPALEGKWRPGSSKRRKSRSFASGRSEAE